MSGSHDDKDIELARLRKENRMLREERDILKKAMALWLVEDVYIVEWFRGEPKPKRFCFIKKEKANFPICSMCKVLGVSQNFYHAWVSCLPSQRQRYDTAFLTYICASHELNYCSYALQGKRIASFVESGRKRMADELKDQGITIDEL